MRASVARLSPPPRTWTLLDAGGRPYASPRPGTLGGHRRTRISGRLDRPSALRAIARGWYLAHRVLVADATAALAAGHRPGSRRLPADHRAWKAGA